MSTRDLFVFLILLLTACATKSAAKAPDAGQSHSEPVPMAEPVLVAIDMFGTKQLTQEQLLRASGSDLRAFGEASMTGYAPPDPLVEKLGRLGDFAAISPSLVGYYEPGGMKYYLTIDFVDRSDAARRMPFLPLPDGTYEDPEGLIADWLTYEAKVNELQVTGLMSTFRVACPAFHCIGDHTHPAVSVLAERFSALVPTHVEQLRIILRDDRDERWRAAAAFLLAYSKDGSAIVRAMVPAFRDGSALVRNGAMRVVADIAFYHPSVDVPLEPVLEAIDYPATLDRNKAAAILTGLLMQPGAERWHRQVASRAGVTILAMLRLQQPNNHNFAYKILTALSGKQYGERDFAAWESWLKAQ